MSDLPDTDDAETPPVVTITAAPPPAVVAFDPNRSMGALSYLLRAAANGEADAQRALFRESVGTATVGLRSADNPSRSPYLLAIEAISYARLSASHRKREDVFDLVNALAIGSRISREVGALGLSDQWANEALSILKSMADGGDTDAAEASAALLANANLLGVPQTHPSSAQVH